MFICSETSNYLLKFLNHKINLQLEALSNKTWMKILLFLKAYKVSWNIFLNNTFVLSFYSGFSFNYLGAIGVHRYCHD